MVWRTIVKQHKRVSRLVDASLPLFSGPSLFTPQCLQATNTGSYLAKSNKISGLFCSYPFSQVCRIHENWIWCFQLSTWPLQVNFYWILHLGIALQRGGIAHSLPIHLGKLDRLNKQKCKIASDEDHKNGKLCVAIKVSEVDNILLNATNCGLWYLLCSSSGKFIFRWTLVLHLQNTPQHGTLQSDMIILFRRS